MPKPTRGVPQKAKDTKKALLDLAHYSKKYWCCKYSAFY